MMIAIYILSIVGFYLAIRQTARRNDNENKIEPEPEVDYDDGSTAYPLTGPGLTNSAASAAFGAYTRAMAQSRQHHYGGRYGEEEENTSLQWNNKSMVITVIISFIPIVNTLGGIFYGCKLFFTHESVKEWFNESSKL